MEISHINIQLLPRSRSLKVYIGECTSPSSFWVQFADDYSEFQTLQENLNKRMEEYLKDSHSTPRRPVTGEAVAIQEGDQWHRGVITRTKSPKFFVFLGDWGRTVTYPVNKTYPLPAEFKTLPWNAVACNLANAQPASLDVTWLRRGSDLFRGLAEGREGLIWIHQSTLNKTALVDLQVLRDGHDYVNVKREMQAWGYLSDAGDWPETRPPAIEPLGYDNDANYSTNQYINTEYATYPIDEYVFPEGTIYTAVEY